MKKLILILVTAISVCGIAIPAQAQKFGHINYEELVAAMPEKAEAQKVLLVAGQKGTFDISTRKASMEKAYRPNELSWLTHELEFEYTSLDEAFKTLQRTYNVQLTIDPNVDLTIKLNATFTQQNIDYVMKVIAMTMNLRAEKIGDNKYVIQNKH